MTENLIKKIIDSHKPFTETLSVLIRNLLTISNIKFHLIESRTKENESLTEKIERKNIESIENEILDITGIRIILYYNNDLDIVEKIIESNFIIDVENSVNKENLFDSNQFGYLSRHYTIQINKERLTMLEWKPYENLKAEIQIRTVLQHAWASISHEISYKNKYEIPKKLNRRLYRLAGLFELVDEQFQIIKDEHLELIQELEKFEILELFDESINSLTLDKYLLSDDELLNNIEKIAIKSGFTSYEYKTEHESSYHYTSNLAILCKMLELHEISDIRNRIELKMKEIDLFFNHLMEERNHEPWSGSIGFFLQLALMIELKKENYKLYGKEINWVNSLYDFVITIIEGIKKL